ncbi:hypothetical protein HA050_19155 [Iodobacter sp. HSC-16F04]|uniref:Uncharacterized protein n=1 Tax=Iodobacter violaceini TaxID=3044271 RepID=A0ABX0KU85_9NEIS|nr:hypothetical protein [Iodobacter violacea]NHQ88226.1 hypothetical protein [Iodobacter violacea]
MTDKSNFLSGLQAGSMVYAVGVILYVGLCLTLVVANLLLGYEEWHTARRVVLMLSDGLLFPFPNDLLPLFYGLFDSWPGAIGMVGGLNLAFFWLAGRFVHARRSNSAIIFAFIGYLLLSVLIYFFANYLFFSVFFMQPHP